MNWKSPSTRLYSRPSVSRAKSILAIAYRSMAFRDLLAGKVQTARRGETIVLDWHFEAPDWTRNHPMRTTVQLGAAGAARIDLQPLRPGP